MESVKGKETIAEFEASMNNEGSRMSKMSKGKKAKKETAGTKKRVTKAKAKLLWAQESSAVGANLDKSESILLPVATKCKSNENSMALSKI